MQASLRAPLPDGGRGARPLPSRGRGRLRAGTLGSRRAAKQQAAARKQLATRNSAEQIEKERLLGHISELKSQALPLLLPALLGCYGGPCHKKLASSNPTLAHDPSYFNT